MAKRFTDTDKWKKVWFRKLIPAHKCLWMYICDTCNQIGIWEVDFESAEFFIGEPLDIEKIKAAFSKQFEELNSGKQWQIKDFISFQYGELVENNNFHKSLINQIKRAGADEPLVRGCCGDKVKDKGTDKVKDKEKGDREVAGEKEPKPTLPHKLKFAKLQNVFLTADEFQKLKEKFGGHDNAMVKIERLSLYVASKGDKYKSHYATILAWDMKDRPEQKFDEFKPKKVEEFDTRQRCYTCHVVLVNDRCNKCGADFAPIPMESKFPKVELKSI